MNFLQAGFRKGRGTRDQIANIPWIIEKAREFQKNIYFCLIDYAKAFDWVDHNKMRKIVQEIGKPSSVISAKKERKTIEWERLEISSRKLEIPREYFM